MTIDRYQLTERLLKRLTASAADRLMPGFTVERIAGGETLVREGDPGDALFLVLDGEVQVVKRIDGDRDEVLDIVGPGGVVGEMSFVDGQPRSSSVRASHPARLLKVERQSVDVLIASAPEAAIEVFGTLLAVMSARLREANASLVALYETGRRLGVAVSAPEICEVVLERAATAVPPAQAGVVALFESGGCQPMVAFGLAPGLPAPFPIHADGDLMRTLRAKPGGLSIGPGQPLTAAMAFLGMRWCLVSELAHQRRTLGLVALASNAGDRPFSDANQVALAILANQAASALARATGAS